jgi:hypothetical protein
MQRVVSRDHMGGTTAQAKLLERAHRRLDDARVIREAEVVITGEGQHALSIDEHGCVLRALNNASRTKLIGLGEFGELRAEVCD